MHFSFQSPVFIEYSSRFTYSRKEPCNASVFTLKLSLLTSPLIRLVSESALNRIQSKNQARGIDTNMENVAKLDH